jgi:hypothetical protein
MYIIKLIKDIKQQFSPFQVKDNIYEPASRICCVI